MLFLTVLLVRKFESRLCVLGLGLDKQKQRAKNVDSEITPHAGQSVETTVNALPVFVFSLGSTLSSSAAWTIKTRTSDKIPRLWK